MRALFVQFSCTRVSCSYVTLLLYIEREKKSIPVQFPISLQALFSPTDYIFCRVALVGDRSHQRRPSDLLPPDEVSIAQLSPEAISGTFTSKLIHIRSLVSIPLAFYMRRIFLQLNYLHIQSRNRYTSRVVWSCQPYWFSVRLASISL